MPDFEVTDDLIADWSDWYGSVLDVKRRQAEDEALQRFAQAHGLTEHQAWKVRRYATAPSHGDESFQRKLTDMIVNSMYGDDGHAPWPQDYVEARKLVDTLLGSSKTLKYVDNRAVEGSRMKPLYHYPDEVEKLRHTSLGKKLFLDQSDLLEYIVSLIKTWEGDLPKPSFPRRTKWDDLDAPSPNTPGQ